MPPAWVLVAVALAGMGYYVGKPVVHATKKASREVCHVVTIGQKCKPAVKK